MRAITRTVVILSLMSFFTDIASEMLYPVIPLYLQSIGYTVVFIGILEGMAEAAAGLSKGFFGRWSDISGKRLIFVQTGYALSAVAKPLMAILTNPLWVLFARTMDRLGKGVRTSARDALLSDESTPENKGKVFGFHRGADTLGAAVGPALALGFLAIYPEQYRFLFFLAIIPGVVSIACSFLLKETTPLQATAEKISFFSYIRYWKTAPKSYRSLVVGLLFFALMNSSDAFLLLMMKHRGATDLQVIGIYIFYNAVYALLSYPMGIVGDRIGLKKILLTGLALFSVVYGGMAIIHRDELFWILFFFYGGYAAATEGVSKAMISNLVPKHQTATAIGFYTSFGSVFTMLASMMGGWLWYVFSPEIMFIISATGTAIALVYIGFCYPSCQIRNP